MDDARERARALKRELSENIERARQNVDDIHALEKVLRSNLAKLRELREKFPIDSKTPKRK
jgi:hypothetical protein